MHWGVWLTVCLLHLPLVFAVWSGAHLYSKLVLRRRGVVIDGHCTSIRRSEESVFTSYLYEVPGHGSYSRETRGYGWMFAAPGESVSVTYDPKKPARGRITGELDARAIEIGVLVVCLVTQAILELPTVVLFQVF